MALIDKYEMSEEKQESLNEAKNRWDTCSIKDKNKNPDICLNELYNLNLKFNNIKENDMDMKWSRICLTY